MNSKIGMRGGAVALMLATGLLTLQGVALAHQTMDAGMKAQKPMQETGMGMEAKPMNKAMGMETKPMEKGGMMRKPAMQGGDMAADTMMDGGMDNGMKK